MLQKLAKVCKFAKIFCKRLQVFSIRILLHVSPITMHNELLSQGMSPVIIFISNITAVDRKLVFNIISYKQSTG